MTTAFQADAFQTDAFQIDQAVNADGGSFKGVRHRLHPDEIAREQRMVEEYLKAQEKKTEELAKKAEKVQPAQSTPSVPPEIPGVVAAAATDEMVRTSLEVAAEERARQETAFKAQAEAEFKRKYWARVMAFVETLQ